eukprot:scaffold3990_cov54-Attheya_sp.AAC.5
MIDIGRPCRLIALFLLASYVIQSDSQERPSPLYQTEQFNSSAFFRQNVCEFQKKYASGGILLENALQGFELRPVLRLNQYVEFKDGALGEEYPGLVAVILDEIASRGNFTWRNSYATLTPPIAGRTFEELLEWSTETYDISINWWDKSNNRLQRGITFPTGWYDASIIMVGKKSLNDTSFDPWSWLDPFSISVWIMIGVTIIFSGIVYWLLENIDKKSDKRGLDESLIENIFLSGILFTTHFEFHPRTDAARIFTLSLSFWALLAAAAYTANLASFLVAKNAPSIQINSVDDAVKRNLMLCVYGGTQTDEAFTSSYPRYTNVIRKELESDVFLGVLNDECVVAVTTDYAWQYYERQGDINSGCKMEQIGRTFMFVSAGFATILDAGTSCTSLIRDVFNVHIMRMQDDGELKTLVHDFLQRTETNNCHLQKTTSIVLEENSNQLDLSSMGGVFILHFGLSIIAIIVALVIKWRERKQMIGYPKTKVKVPTNIVEHPVVVDGEEEGKVEEGDQSESLSVLKNYIKELTLIDDDQNETIAEMNKQVLSIMRMLNKDDTSDSMNQSQFCDELAD